MKYLVSILIITCSMTMGWAQQAFEPKVDGTKYYIQVYDGETNEKILYQNAAHPSWQTKIQLADFFDGSLSQLWTFKATAMYPGYYSVFNHDENLTEAHHLMSWNWNAYLGANRDPADSPEMQYRFIEVADGWYKFETIEKEDGLNGIAYTPGADALNLKAEGFVSFSDVKSADVTPQNMINNVFRFVEFDPLTAYDNSLEIGENLYKTYPNAPETARYDFFYALEKGREARVFATESEILASQDMIYEAIAKFTRVVEFDTMLTDALTFINASDADSDVKTSFTALVNNADEAFNAGSLSSEDIEVITLDIAAAKELVEAIIAAQTFGTSLTGLDSRLRSGVANAVSSAKAILISAQGNADAYNAAILHLEKMEDTILEINTATELLEGTQEFEEAKEILSTAIEAAIVAINTVDVTSEELDASIAAMQEAIKTFQKALEAGDTLVELLNAGFESDLADWVVDSPTPSAAYPENKGVDGSRSITCWKGSEYQMRVYQSISGIPNGTYTVSCFATVRTTDDFSLFAASDANYQVLPLVNNGTLTQRTVEIEVTNGMLEFGLKGSGSDNMVPAGSWVVFDAFEVKWASQTKVTNGDFENDLTDWSVEGDVSRAYPENKGVDGSRSITCYGGADYAISVSKTLSGLENGTYAVSAMAKTNVDNAFVVSGESAGVESMVPVTGNQLMKFKTVVTVTDGTLTVGVHGAGENNAVPAGNWVVFDNVEVVRMPNIPVVNAGFNADLTDWLVDSPTPEAAYAQNRGIDGSRSITWWRGSDYQMMVYQSINNISNGTYKISCVYRNSSEGAIGLFAESGANIVDLPLPLYNNGEQDLTKSEIEITVSDGTLSFGIRGQGDNNGVPAGQWIVYDEFQVLLKTITPVYEEAIPQNQEVIPEIIERAIPESEPKIIYSQGGQSLNIQSSDVIVKYAVFSLTGSMVDTQQTSRNSVSIPLNRGIYIVRITTENGVVDTKKMTIY
ncbi:T9SS type A sorting domain-containing protein [Saccharicrinis sp. GN24d3]|uniref:T9SS type A sorting domain-containing protein n=1 Tax=Saccharicrinis sp. GN24d3 TaxID=3458416 RepID=UPI004035EDAA